MAFACGRHSKNQKYIPVQQEYISSIDSTPIVIDSTQKQSQDLQEDSVLPKLIPPSTQDFHSLSAKISINYRDKDNSIPPLTGYLRLYKDSSIWLSLYSFGLIEVYRIYLNPHKIQLLDYLNSSAQLRKPSFIQTLLHVPFDFQAIQNFILGIAGNKEFIQGQSRERLGFYTQGHYQNYQVENHYNQDSMLMHSIYRTEGKTRALIDFTAFSKQTEPHLNFPIERKLTIIGHDTSELNLTFKDLKWNQTLKFPFNIPSRYKVYSDF